MSQVASNHSNMRTLPSSCAAIRPAAGRGRERPYVQNACVIQWQLQLWAAVSCWRPGSHFPFDALSDRHQPTRSIIRTPPAAGKIKITCEERKCRPRGGGLPKRLGRQLRPTDFDASHHFNRAPGTPRVMERRAKPFKPTGRLPTLDD